MLHSFHNTIHPQLFERYVVKTKENPLNNLFEQRILQLKQLKTVCDLVYSNTKLTIYILIAH